ncbi:hypothetical protein chiPu_0031396, partial [Chiloscyllium punctatum]|nr:hypothetical protein [Chiloscyllium punctatum]
MHARLHENSLLDVTSGPDGARGPIVRLGLQRAAPGVERVVDDHAVLQHLVVIGEVGGEAERDREQAAALRAQIVPRRVGAPDNRRQMVERRILDLVDAQNGIERAAFALVREFHAIDIVGNPARPLGDRDDLILRDVDELRIRIDEAPDQPGASNTVDLRVFTCHPLARGGADVAARREPLLSPIRNTAFEEIRLD